MDNQERVIIFLKKKTVIFIFLKVRPLIASAKSMHAKHIRGDDDDSKEVS